MKVFEILRDWAEVWALLIPLLVILIYKPAGEHIKPLVWYVIIGFILNFLAIFMVQFYYWMPSWLTINNNLLYNIHSFIRVILVGWYLITVREYRYTTALKSLLGAYILFVLMTFLFIESPFFLSTRLLSAESIVLLVLCLSYFFRSMQDDSTVNWLKHPSFIVCAGVSLYAAVTFFIFLFFYQLHFPLHRKDISFAIITMRIYTAVFVIFCILLAMALYKTKKTGLRSST